jgi:hypothetical protein
MDVPSEPCETEWVADAFRAIGARDGEVIGGADGEGTGGAPTRALAASVRHPPVELPGTERRFLQATSNGVEYELYVSLPNDYDATMRRYPVIYLLDADDSFAIARNVVEHLSDRDHLTRAVIVGIAYHGPPAYRMNRTRDYTPKYSPNGGYGPEYQAVSGGGPQFLAFIEHELVPFIEREYRVTEKRVLVGHSYGGLFASWTLLTRPRLFDGYVIVSPSLWYDDHWIFDMERRRRDAFRDASARVFLSVGSREINNLYDMPADLDRFAAVLEVLEFPALRLRWSIEENETHNSIFPGALSDGLRFVLEGR